MTYPRAPQIDVTNHYDIVFQKMLSLSWTLTSLQFMLFSLISVCHCLPSVFFTTGRADKKIYPLKPFFRLGDKIRVASF